MVKKSWELKSERSKTKMDGSGGTKAVQAVNQNFFQTPQYSHQISNGTSRLDSQRTGFAPEYQQGVLLRHLSKDEFSQLTGSALPSAARSENAQNIHHGISHQFGASYNFANVRPPELKQPSSAASRTLPSNEQCNIATSKETQFELQQRQNYYPPLQYQHANNTLAQSLNAHTNSQQMAYRAMQSEAPLANRQYVTATGSGQNIHGHHQPPSYAAIVAAPMTLDSENQCRPQLPPFSGERPRFPSHQRLFSMQSQYMNHQAYAQTPPQFLSGTQNRFLMIPSQAPNTIPYLSANCYSHTPVASDTNVSSPKESSILSPRSAPTVMGGESYATLFQYNKLQPALRGGHTVATSNSSVIDQNPSAPGRIPVQGSPTIDRLNGIPDNERNTVDLPLNSIDDSTEKGNPMVTSDDIIKLHDEVMGMREQFVHLLRNYKQKYLAFNSVNGDKTLPASQEHGSNLSNSNDANISEANGSILPDHAPNFYSAPATFSSQSEVLMTKNTPKANHNSHQDSHLNQMPSGSVHESNQCDKILHVMKDSSICSSASLPSTIKESPTLNQSQIKKCQQSKQEDSLLVSKATDFENNCEGSFSNKDATSESKPVQPNLETVVPSLPCTSPGQSVPETASTRLPPFNSPLGETHGLSPAVAVSKPQKKTQRFKNYSPNRELGAAGKKVQKKTMKQLKDISLLDDQWKKKPPKESKTNLPPSPNLDHRPVSSSERFREVSCTIELKTSQIAGHVNIPKDRCVQTGLPVAVGEPGVTQPVERKHAIVNDLINAEVQSSDLRTVPLVQKISKDFQEVKGQLAKQNEKDMSLSHHYRMAINSLLDKLHSYSTFNSADTEEITSADDSSKSENVIQIKTEPCESEIEITNVDSSESGNVLQMKTETCESVVNAQSLHLEKCVLSEPQTSPSCRFESSHFQARGVPLLLAEDVPDPHLKIESICSLAEGNTFYNSQVAHVFDTNNVPESNDLDILSSNIVSPPANVEKNVLPNSQSLGDSKISSDLSLNNYPHLLQTAETNKREEDFSHIQEHGKQLSLSIAKPLEDARSEPYLNSQLSELLRAFPDGIQQTESVSLTTVQEGTENQGTHGSQLSEKQKQQNVQKSKIYSQNTFPAPSLLMNKSSSIALDKYGSPEIPKELQVQKSATGGHIHVTVVDSKQIFINVIESATKPGEDTSHKNNQDVPNFHSAMTKIVIEANEKSLGDPCRKQENVDSDDEVVWVKTEAPSHIKCTTPRTQNKPNEGGMVQPLAKDVSLYSIDHEIGEKSDCEDYSLSKTPLVPDRLVGCKKIKKKASRLIVKTDFLKSKHSRSTEPVKSGKRKTTQEGGVGKGCKIDKATVPNLPFVYNDSSIQKRPKTGEESRSTEAGFKLSVDNVCAGKTPSGVEAKSDTHNCSAFGKENTRTQAIQEYFQRRKEESVSAGKKVPKGNGGAAYHNTSSPTPYKKPSVDLGKLKRLVMQASEIELKQNLAKHMQPLEAENMPPPTTSKVPSPTSEGLKLCVKQSRLGSPENNLTSEHIVGPNNGKEMSVASSSKSAEPIGKDFIKRVAYLGVSNGVIKLSTLDFPLLKESGTKRKQEGVNPLLTKQPETSNLEPVSRDPKMLEFKLCPDLLMGSRLVEKESAGAKPHAGVEHDSRKGSGSETEDFSNIPFKKRKLDMTEFHGSVVLQESTTVGQMMPTAEKDGPTATSGLHGLFNTYRKMYLDKQKTGLPNPS